MIIHIYMYILASLVLSEYINLSSLSIKLNFLARFSVEYRIYYNIICWHTQESIMMIIMHKINYVM